MKVSALSNQYNSVLSRANANTSVLSASYIDGSLLKPFELSASSRGLLGDLGVSDFYPLWFHFENERNVHLWKEGLSLADAGQCRIWIEPLQLIEKQLRRSHSEPNPFHSPGYFLDSQAHSEDQSEANRYYQTLATLLERALPHLHALSHVAAQALEAQTALRDIVISLRPGVTTEAASS